MGNIATANTSRNMKKWLIPLLLFCALAPFTPDLDLWVSSQFFTPALTGKGTFYTNRFFDFLYSYGELFGLGLGGICASIFLLSLFSTSWKKWRRGALSLLLTLVVGAGILVNLGFKEHWGRPRPREVTEFGGKHYFRPFWSPHFGEKDVQKSFPSGHVAMGFYYFSLAHTAKRYGKQWLYFAALFLILFFGVGLMIGRVVQGGHFLSDVLTSCLLMWVLSLAIDHYLWERDGALSD